MAIIRVLVKNIQFGRNSTMENFHSNQHGTKSETNIMNCSCANTFVVAYMHLWCRSAVCALLAKMNKLNTMEIISQWKTDLDTTCNMRNQAVEYSNHLFFQCHYSKIILHIIVTKLQLIVCGNNEIDNEFDQVLCTNNGNKSFQNLKNTMLTVLI